MDERIPVVLVTQSRRLGKSGKPARGPVASSAFTELRDALIYANYLRLREDGIRHEEAIARCAYVAEGGDWTGDFEKRRGRNGALKHEAAVERIVKSCRKRIAACSEFRDLRSTLGSEKVGNSIEIKG